MRILFLSHYFPPEGNAPASRVYELSKRWVQAGHYVQVITCAPNVPDGVIYKGYRNRLKQTEYMDGIHVTRVWTYLAPNKGTTRRILNFLSFMFVSVIVGLFVKRPDIVIATSPQFFCGWAGVLLSKLRRVPFVLEIRDIWPESIIAVGAMRRGRMVRWLERLELKMYAAADHIVTVGEGYRRQLMERHVDPRNMSVIPNGVDIDRFSPGEKDTAVKLEHGINGQFVCSYIGTVGMACGLDVVLRASELLHKRGRDDIYFLIVGDGACRSDLEMQTRNMGLRNVIFTGRKDKEDIPRYFSVSDACLVHLRKTDLFKTVLPSKIFEATGMAKPIIIGVPGSAEQLVMDAHAGIAIEPDNARELADAVVRLADHPELRAEYGNAGHEYVVKNYNRDFLAQDYLRVLDQVIPAASKGKKATAEQLKWTHT